MDKTILDGYLWCLLAAAFFCAALFALTHRDRKHLLFAAITFAAGAVFGAFLSKFTYMICKMSFTLSEGFAETARSMYPNRFSFFGGAVGACLAAVIAGKAAGIRPAIRSLDVFAPWGLLAASAARFGEALLGTYGCGRYFDPEENPFLCRLPFCLPVRWDEYYTEYYLAVFIMEGAFALVLFAAAFLYFRKRPHCFLRCLFLLCLGQILFESLRTESFVWHEFVKVEQLFSMITLEAVLVWYWLKSGKARGTGLPPLLALAVAGVFVACEFFLDKPIPFTDEYELPHLVTYAVMIAGLVLLGWCERRARLSAVRAGYTG